MGTVEQLIRDIPKAELHLHIEGTLSPEMLFQKATEHALKSPYQSLEDVHQAYQVHDLQSFLDLYVVQGIHRALVDGEQKLGITSKLILFKRMLEAGLVASINSDDPAYLGGGITENFLAAHRALSFKQEQIYQLAKNSFEASFLSDEEKQGYIEELNLVMLNH